MDPSTEELESGSTPTRVTGSIRRFLETLVRNAKPEFLPLTAISPDYRPRYCLDNCEAETRRSGDPTVFGWMIWESRKNAFIEAEFHAVLKRRGELIDITPRVDGEHTILFVPDPSRSAVRVDWRTWRSWTSHKWLRGKLIEETRQVCFQDLAAPDTPPRLADDTGNPEPGG
jgi:hypothetical protein